MERCFLTVLMLHLVLTMVVAPLGLQEKFKKLKNGNNNGGNVEPEEVVKPILPVRKLTGDDIRGIYAGALDTLGKRNWPCVTGLKYAAGINEYIKTWNGVVQMRRSGDTASNNDMWEGLTLHVESVEYKNQGREARARLVFGFPSDMEITYNFKYQTPQMGWSFVRQGTATFRVGAYKATVQVRLPNSEKARQVITKTKVCYNTISSDRIEVKEVDSKQFSVDAYYKSLTSTNHFLQPIMDHLENLKMDVIMDVRDYLKTRVANAISAFPWSCVSGEQSSPPCKEEEDYRPANNYGVAP